MTNYEWRYEFSFRLRKRMRMKRLTQKELAYLTGLGEDTISRYINRERVPSIEIIVRIARALGCTPNDLIMFDDDTMESKKYIEYDQIQ